ncbi:hypothetical protein F7725_024806 [Dissostichus mawsoni]|uniref:NTR domain-containing protein n=1 Tax=Dissostichus mawsoni TaxID=36200 RepID=A0A7J5X9D4_DISMA|nr:hypothetical protein F7725_024806 [Dissostichus mawsoni]
MRKTLLWLLASLAFVSLTSRADGAPLEVMSAPNLLRVGTAENVFVECQDCTGADKRVEIHVMNHPIKNKRLATASVTLTSTNNFQELVQIVIPTGDFSRDPSIKQYVYLQAQFPDRLLEKVVLVSFQSGHIFIQTDKTLYTPNSRGIYSGNYRLAEFASLGLWKIVTKFRSNPQQSFQAEFEVKERGDEMVEAELRNIPIVKSPYAIHFKKTPKYFKPGMTFEVVVEVVNPDNTPAQGVPVVVQPGYVNGITANNGMARLTINTRNPQLTITARTNDPRISSRRQASATMTALPYITKSKNYIHIGVDSADVELGNNLKINLNINRRESHDYDITYLIMSRGQLVLKGRHKTRGQVLISLIVLITKDMLPSFRIIAYYHTNGNEVVSDSVWVDVKDSCMGSVWDVLEKYDTGCTPGGGKDGMSVFYDAGLLFESNTASGTPYRQGICVGDPLEVIVQKEFFIDLRLPYSAVLGEQLEVKAILRNYSPNPATVRVDLFEEDFVCSSASKRGKYRQEVRIGAQTTRSVPFIIIPMKEGAFRIEVKAAVTNSSLNDGIMKMLRVVGENKFLPSWRTLLTAYVAKVFAMANNLLTVHRPHICEAIKFLILNAQQPDGLFREVGTVIHGEMIGDVRGADSDASMTAFCLIAMQESRTLCAASVGSLPSSIDRAVAYLERRLPSLTNPYAVAMTSYAMANENKMNREILYKFASPELNHWPMSKGRIYTLEATAYALLALVKAQAFEDARPVVRWFNEQQRVGGGYGSTQMESLYYTLPKQKESDCQKFNLSVQLIPGSARTIAKYEMDKVLSERGSLIIYLYKKQIVCSSTIQRGKVDSYCSSAEIRNAYVLKNCSMQKKANISNDQRTAKALYKVKLEVFEGRLSTDIYTMRVLEAIKEGTLDVGPLNKLRTFLSYLHCRESLDLVVGKTYLIMGSSDDIHRDDAHQTYQYVLGQRTWIEYWPIEAECQADEHRPTCLGMEEMFQHYQLFGCQQ